MAKGVKKIFLTRCLIKIKPKSFFPAANGAGRIDRLYVELPTLHMLISYFFVGGFLENHSCTRRVKENMIINKKKFLPSLVEERESQKSFNHSMRLERGNNSQVLKYEKVGGRDFFGTVRLPSVSLSHSRDLLILGFSLVQISKSSQSCRPLWVSLISTAVTEESCSSVWRLRGFSS